MSAMSELHADICQCYSQAVQHAVRHGLSEHVVRTAFDHANGFADEDAPETTDFVIVRMLCGAGISKSEPLGFVGAVDVFDDYMREQGSAVFEAHAALS